MAAALWKALAFGAVVAGSIGPIALLIFGTAARQGLAAGGFAALGAALADLAYALAAFTAGALVLPLLAAYETATRVACALVLIALGAWMLLSEARSRVLPAPAQGASGRLWPTFGLTIVNPMTVVMFAGIVPQLPVAGSFATAGWLALALCLGSLAVNGLIAAAGAWLGRVLPGAGWRRAISTAAAGGIVAFGVAGLAAV